MELLADYIMQIMYHPSKANLVADVLSRRRGGCIKIKEVQELIEVVANLSLCTVL